MPKTPDFFRDKSILITGAGSGIGLETARIFGREGAGVFCADLDEGKAAQAADAVTKAGGRGVAHRVDVTSRAEVNAMTEAALQAFGQVNFLFNSAGGFIRRCPFLEIDDATWDKAYDLNVKGTFYAMQAVIPHMIERGGGVIVNVGSMAHINGGPGGSIHYASTKGAVVTLSRGIAREFAQQGIRCMSLSPGYIDTPFQASLPPDRRETLIESIPMKRFGRADEVGEMVLFMCSDACEFMTADTYFINGGAGYR